MDTKKITIIGLQSARNFADRVGKLLGVKPVYVDSVDFLDTESKASPLLESVRGKDVFVCSSLDLKIGAAQCFMTQLFTIANISSSFAASIRCFSPYFLYCRGDQGFDSRSAPTAQVVLRALGSASAQVPIDVTTIELHNPAVQYMGWPIRFDNFSGSAVFAAYLNAHGLIRPGTVIAPPDKGGVSRAVQLARLLNVPDFFSYKVRSADAKVDDIYSFGDVSGKNVVMFDDMIATGETMLKSCEGYYADGAESLTVCVVHAILSGRARESIAAFAQRHPDFRLISTNSINNVVPIGNFHVVVDLSPLFAESVKVITGNEPLSSYFTDWKAVIELYNGYHTGWEA